MQILNSRERYGVVAKSIHWLTVALVLAAWLLGQFGDDFPRGAPRDSALFVHISAGLLVVAFLIARLAWRTATPVPAPEPTPFDPWLPRTAALAHAALYLLLAAVPLVGIVVMFARGRPLPVLGLFEIPSPWPADRAFARSVKEVHEVMANVLVVVAGLHAMAALAHHWLLKDRTLRRMLPGAS